MLPTINAFYHEERLGIIQFLRDAPLDRKVNVRIITPTNVVIEEMIGSMTELLDEGKKINIQSMETVTGTAVIRPL